MTSTSSRARRQAQFRSAFMTTSRRLASRNWIPKGDKHLNAGWPTHSVLARTVENNFQRNLGPDDSAKGINLAGAMRPCSG